MLKVLVDGVEVEVPHGSTVMDATNKVGTYVPHFCYHRKLSIAANCRMCLVEVEKAPKPLPACATPVTDGMKVWTHSAAAKKAQNGVMEFLLINHPLDCPICDQGGECQLQDLAVGYGHSNSRYTEEKRVVSRKELGPLVAAEEMTRCIQCTRCVRFGQEIAGIMELGLAGRGENSEIVSFVGKAVESELSGNMIDLCPVGALTSEPFRYKARTWELSRRRSVSPHDGLGSNLLVQVKQKKVMRVLPLENEAINECWLSDRDRFSYEGLNSDDRLRQPMVKRNGRWEAVDWQDAVDETVWGLKGKEPGFLASPHSTLEELFLAAKLAKGLNGAADFRLRQSDFSADGKRAGIPSLGMPVTELANLDRVLVVGSFLRKEHPLVAHRLRQAAKRGTRVYMVHSVDDDWLMPIAGKKVVAPSDLPAAVEFFGKEIREGKNAAVLLGNFAQHHPQAAQIHAAAQALDVKVGLLAEAANSVGGYLAGLPVNGNVRDVLGKKAIVVLNAETELDCADPQAAAAGLRQADFVVALSPWQANLDYANVLLPIGAFSETAGTFVNMEGRVQSFHATVVPPGEARPGWKVLRVLGTMLGLPGFEYDTVEQVRGEALGGKDVPALLANEIRIERKSIEKAGGGIERIADVPIYFSDALVRRSGPLQDTNDARPPQARMSGKTLQRLGVGEGGRVRVSSAAGEAFLAAVRDDTVAEDCVRIAAAHASTAALGPMFGTLSIEKAAVEKVA
ncbi:MAG TPA: NADH-quinone oxidoreductase subunit NuoG [Burkholderiales bacterium]|nr:NADH-quinone oxidoreductase subunit NuoG [Burkholderiales bacterium]